ncbi:MAG TPA: hypothetical protein O0X23_04175 [Methanocorpusculum sp.]|nr:hypothetical protein [Methanocorpusculum sp.]
MSEKDTPPGSNGPFDQEQYDWLLRCEQAGDFSEWNKWVRESLASGETRDIPEIKLAGAHLE